MVDEQSTVDILKCICYIYYIHFCRYICCALASFRMPGLGFVVPLCKKSTYVQPQNKNAHEKFHTVNLLRVDVQYFGNKYIRVCIWMVALMGDSIHISLTILNCIYLWYKRKHIYRHKTYVHTLFCMVLLRKNQNSVGFVAVQNKTQLTIRTSNDFGLVNGTDDVYVKIVIGCILSEFSQENNITNVLYTSNRG